MSDDDGGLAQDSPMPDTPDEQFTATVIVVGSFAWENEAAVRDVLESWWHEHNSPHINLVTSGCPRGAEETARKIGAEHGWTLTQIRDEELILMSQAIAFAFIKDESAGAEQAVAWLEMGKIWHRVVREDTVRTVSPWATR
jgi:hypothetical protein